MPMLALDFFVLCLATEAIVAAWMHEQGLFEDIRDRLATWLEWSGDYDPKTKTWSREPLWLAKKVVQLLLCPFCLTYHAAFWLTAAFYLPSLWLPAPWNVVWRLPLYVLGAASVAHLVRDLAARLKPPNPLEIDD